MSVYRSADIRLYLDVLIDDDLEVDELNVTLLIENEDIDERLEFSLINGNIEETIEYNKKEIQEVFRRSELRRRNK